MALKIRKTLENAGYHSRIVVPDKKHCDIGLESDPVDIKTLTKVISQIERNGYTKARRGMGSLNKVMLIGNLGRDPEIRYTQAGSAVANFSLATTDRWTDRQGQRQERTEWHDIVAFDRLADLAQNYLKKGKSVFIEGRLQTRSWEDPQGQKRYRTEVVANGMQFLDARPQGEGGGQ